MSEPQSNGGAIVLRWLHLVLILAVQLLVLGGIWGSLKYQVEEHERRLEIIEKRQEENFLSRQEFEKRHEELQKQVEQNREELQQMEMREIDSMQKAPRRPY